MQSLVFALAFPLLTAASLSSCQPPNILPKMSCLALSCCVVCFSPSAGQSRMQDAMLSSVCSFVVCFQREIKILTQRIQKMRLPVNMYMLCTKGIKTPVAKRINNAALMLTFDVAVIIIIIAHIHNCTSTHCVPMSCSPECPSSQPASALSALSVPPPRFHIVGCHFQSFSHHPAVCVPPFVSLLYLLLQCHFLANA